MTVERREQCPECAANGGDTKGDNLVFHTSGLAYCYVCEKDTSNGIDEEHDTKQQLVDKGLEHGEYLDIIPRNISKETCQKYGYMRKPKKFHIANFYDAAGNVVMQKIRYPNKGFEIKGNTSHSSDLWGASLFTPNENVWITITEGELDCLSVAEVNNCQFPVVSLPCGADKSGKGVRKVLSKNLEYLQGFKYVVLAFDNDPPGVSSAEACLDLFEPGKVRTAKWPEKEVTINGKTKIAKDASDFLQVGDRRTIIKTLQNAVEYMPQLIVSGDEIKGFLEKHKRETIPWPSDAANRVLGEMEKGRVYLLTARPGIGKTEMMQWLFEYFISMEKKAGCVPLEQPISEIVLKTHDHLYGTHYYSVKNEELPSEAIEECAEKIGKYLVFYDVDKGGAKLEPISHAIPFMVRVQKCQLVVYDNLSFAAGSNGKQDWTELDKTIAQFKSLAVKYNFIFFVVCHLNRVTNKDGTDRKPSKNDIRGSQGLEMFTDQILGLWRDTEAESLQERNTLEIHCLKDRVTGQAVGKVFNLFYNVETGRLEDKKEIF